MKNSTKVLLVATLVGTAGFFGALRLVNAAQPQQAMMGHDMGDMMASVKFRMKQMAQNHETNEGTNDRETNDDAKEQAEERQEAAKLPSLAKISAQPLAELAARLSWW